MIKTLLVAAALVQAVAADTTYEGKWYVSDQTNNNTGEREVYAFQTYFKENGRDWVTLTMRCSTGSPTFFVEWEDVEFPDQTVLTIGPAPVAETASAGQRYMFEKSDDALERGLRASPESSAKIIAALGTAKDMGVTAHLASGTRTVKIEIGGAQSAWSRISRHCPVRILPRPPL